MKADDHREPQDYEGYSEWSQNLEVKDWLGGYSTFSPSFLKGGNFYEYSNTGTNIQDLLTSEAERRSQIFYNKAYAELDEEGHKLMMTGAGKFLRSRMSFPGQCCDCGATMDEDKYQCRPGDEAMRQSEWTAYHRKAAYKGNL